MSDAPQTPAAPAAPTTPTATEPEKPKGTWRERMEAAKAAKAAKGPDPLAPGLPPLEVPGTAASADPDRLERAKAAAEKLRNDQDSRRRQQVAQAQRDQELSSTRAELEKAKAAEKQLADIARLVNEDPYAAMHKLGITVDNLAKHGTPEAAIAKLQGDYDKRVAAAEAATQALRAELQAEKDAQATENGKAQLRSLVDSGAYPALATLPERVLFRDVNEVLVEAHRREGVWYSFEDALTYLESDYSGAASRRKPAPTTATTQNGAPRPGQDADGPRRPPTNQQTTSVSSLSKPLKDLPTEERRKAVSEILRERFRRNRDAAAKG